MSQFIVDLWMDGYETEQEMDNACSEFIKDRLNSTGSSVKIFGKINDDSDESLYSGTKCDIVNQLICEHEWWDQNKKCKKCNFIKNNISEVKFLDDLIIDAENIKINLLRLNETFNSILLKSAILRLKIDNRRK